MMGTGGFSGTLVILPGTGGFDVGVLVAAGPELGFGGSGIGGTTGSVLDSSSPVAKKAAS